jgi:hypothetical protein
VEFTSVNNQKCEGKKEDRMVKQNFIKMILTLLLLLTTGCSLTGDIAFTATIDGEEFKAIVGFWDDGLVEGFGQIFTIDRNGNTFTIFIAGEFEEKTYTLGSFEQTAEGYAIYLNTAQGLTCMSQSGTLTITSKTDRLEGTFAMTLIGITESGEEIVLDVTDGMFDLPGSPII